MGRIIDERIVQMTFNNQEFENRAKTTISTLAKLKTATDSLSNGEWLNGVGKSIANSGLQTLTVTTQKISEGFSALEQIAIGALRNIGAQAEATARKLLKELTLDNIATGWGKYVDLTGSVQTLINSTGKGVDEIDRYLERLMWYSDETSFGFTDMTKALGTMVSSGGDINKLIPMLMGVGNAVAYAGKGASEFSRVIYNLNQSYSSGFLNTMDWKSIELASADSKMLKEQLLAAAVELGTINKEQAKLENFRDLLSDKVFTRDVMEKAFGRFAEFTLEVEKAVADGTYETASEAMAALAGNFEKFQEDAFTAAQSAKSFREAIDATKDAVSSGWMQSFKLIFGNYEESKALWTDVTGSLWDWFASGAEARNNVLKEWKSIWTSAVEAKNAYDSLDDRKKKFIELDGFYEGIDDSLTQTQALWKAFSRVIDDIRESFSNAWAEVFNVPEISEMAKSIFNFLEGIRGRLNEIHRLFQTADRDKNVISTFQTVLTSLFSVLKAVSNVGKEIINSFIKPLGERLQPVLKDIIGIIDDLASILFKNATDLSNDLSPVQKILENILKILDPMIKVLGDIFKWIHDITSTMKKNAFDEEAEHISLFAKALEAAGKALDFIVSVFSGAINILSSVGNVLTQVFDKIKDVIKSFAESSGTDVSELAKGGLLGYILIGLTSVVNKLKKIDLLQVLEGIMNFFKKDSKGLIDTIKETFETLTNSIKTFTESIKIKMLEEVSNSLIKLAGALLILSLIDSGKLAVSLGALAGMLIEMIGAVKLLEKIDGGNSLIKTAVVFDQIATGLIMMSIALKLISGIQPEQMVNSLGMLGFALVEVMVLMDRFKNMDPEKVTSSAKAFKKISEGLILLSVALKVLASINPERMVSSLTLLGVSLLELMGFLTITSEVIKDSQGNKMIAMGKALTNMGVGLIALSVALKVMSTIDHNAMSSALLGLTVSLGALGLFMAAMGKFVGGADFIAISAGMLILSTALIAFGAALAIIGSLSLETLGKGLLGVAGALLIIGGAGALFGTLSPLILLTAVAFGAFGLALITAAEGIMKFMAAYTIIQALGPQFAASLVDVFEQATAALVAAIPIFIVGIIDAVLQTSEKIIDLAMYLLDLLIYTISEGLPRIIGLGMSIVNGILTGIRDHIGEFVIVTLEIIGNLINGLAIGLPTLLDALLQFIIDAVNGLAEAIRANAGDFGAAIGNLASAIIEGIIGGLFSMIGSFATNFFDFGIGLIDGIKSFFSGDESTKSNNESGQKVVTDIERGIDNESPKLLKQSKSLGEDTTDEYRKGNVAKKPELLTEIETMAKEVTDKMDVSEDSKTSGELTLEGLYNGLTSPSWLNQISEAGAAAGRAFMKSYNATVKIKSPSKEMEESGKYTIMGLVEGLSNTRSIEETGREIGNMVLNAIRSALDSANSILEDDLNPVITPILDLSNVQNNARYIGDLLGVNTSMNSAMAINSLGSPLNRINQNGVTDRPKELVMYNTFEINGVQNIDRTQVKNMANMLYDEINTLLGNQI